MLRKGFESNGNITDHRIIINDISDLDYMKLKRILSKQTIQKRDQGKEGKGGKSENLLFRTSGGLCFDVCPDDKTMYLDLLYQQFRA